MARKNMKKKLSQRRSFRMGKGKKGRRPWRLTWLLQKRRRKMMKSQVCSIGREASLGQGVGISWPEEWGGKSFFSCWPPAFDRKAFLSKGSLLFTGHSYSRN